MVTADYASIDRQIEDELRASLQAVACTMCGAPVGSPCMAAGRSMSGPRTYHRTRYTAADVIETSNAVLLRSFGASPRRLPNQPSRGERQ